MARNTYICLWLGIPTSGAELTFNLLIQKQDGATEQQDVGRERMKA